MIYSVDTILGIILLGVLLISTVPTIPYVQLLYAVKSLKYSKLSYEAAVNSYYFAGSTTSNVYGFLYQLNYQQAKQVFASGKTYKKELDSWIVTQYKFEPYQYTCPAYGCNCRPTSYTYYLLVPNEQKFAAQIIYPDKIDNIQPGKSMVKGHV